MTIKRRYWRCLLTSCCLISFLRQADTQWGFDRTKFNRNAGFRELPIIRGSADGGNYGCPPLTQCLQDIPTIENLCSSFHAIVIGMWACVQLRLDGRETFYWREDEPVIGNCWRLQTEYPEMKDMLKCHNDFYHNLNTVYREACILESNFFECMGWTVSGQIDCVSRGSSILTGSTILLDIQLPQKKSLISAQNICIRSKSLREKECYRDSVGGCGTSRYGIPWNAPAIESRLEQCLRQKSVREAEAMRRAEELLDDLQSTLKTCVEDHAGRLWTRLYGKVFGRPHPNATRSFIESTFNHIPSTLPFNEPNGDDGIVPGAATLNANVEKRIKQQQQLNNGGDVIPDVLAGTSLKAFNILNFLRGHSAPTFNRPMNPAA